MSSSLIEHFDELPDPRVRGRTDYPLIEIVFLCISAIISGFDGWEAIEDFGLGKLEWLRKFLPYENGIPRLSTQR
ncbi:Transposase [Legionella pneumophila]|uniref:transposase family protein n=1 Tax=Legionella pneumophila TaxID=446 RepID=UPI00077070A9|nr:transposase family protein [Legionella pneumophila]CZJ92151.1 Transposase [Legionella pneumophila]CZJ95504.1 Transposase [Legionella pneumophila]CZK41319.1 Transposase [Legionella pneumophila]CZK44406.1 Transposase [Legionella pneumophila]CZK59820.1 Transposase [Legionella pneumophila]